MQKPAKCSTDDQRGIVEIPNEVTEEEKLKKTTRVQFKRGPPSVALLSEAQQSEADDGGNTPNETEWGSHDLTNDLQS